MAARQIRGAELKGDSGSRISITVGSRGGQDFRNGSD
jgi:hypothetical protein